MKIFKRFLVFVLCIAVPEAVGYLSSVFSRVDARSFYLELNRPALAPPGYLFGIVWAILYALMGYASYRIIVSGAEKTLKREALLIYMTQLVFNFMWSIVFFGVSNFAVAFLNILVILILIIINAVKFYRIDKLAGLIMIPYILWVSFATYLNLFVMLNN